MKILGIDEAGRGPVIGPLVMCGYLIDEKNMHKLKEIGVKDSKMLTEKRRNEIEKNLKKIADKYQTIKVDADEIDALRTKSNLNKIEIEKMRFLVNKMNPDRVIIDSIERDTEKFSEKLREGLHCEAEIIAENFADIKYPVVGAASIIAKVFRDNKIAEMHNKYGFFGSGYTSDERTIAFLKDWIKKNKEFPNIVRKSWVTAVNMVTEKKQTSLDVFAGDKNG